MPISAQLRELNIQTDSSKQFVIWNKTFQPASNLIVGTLIMVISVALAPVGP